MPLVEIKWFKGRDDATKAKTIDLVTKAVCEGGGPEAVVAGALGVVEKDLACLAEFVAFHVELVVKVARALPR